MSFFADPPAPPPPISWMYGVEIALPKPRCACCQRTDLYLKASRIVSNPPVPLCSDCFNTWYDGVRDPVAIGNEVRKKHGLPELAADRSA